MGLILDTLKENVSDLVTGDIRPEIPEVPAGLNSPISEEQLKELKERALDFLKEFGLLYAKNYGTAILQDALKQIETQEAIPWKLSHRDFDSVQRTDMFAGEVKLMKGEGLGAFGKWENVFIAERQDYCIDVFNSEKDFKSSHKPHSTIHPAGYKLIEDVSEHYCTEFAELAHGLDVSETEIAKHSKKLTDDCWAFAHCHRKNYVFQLVEKKPNKKKQKDKKLSSSSSEIDETTIRKALKKCIDNASPRDTTTLEGKAFDKTCEDLPGALTYLKDWIDDGLEAEMLVDLLMETCLPELKEAILQDIGIGGLPIGAQIKVWYETHKIIHLALTKAMNLGWKIEHKAVTELHKRIDPVVREGLERIRQVLNKIEQKIKELFLTKLESLMARYVAPVVNPFYNILEAPMKKSFRAGHTILRQQVNQAILSRDKNMRNSVLDKIPRDIRNQEEMFEPLRAGLKRCISDLNALDVVIHKDLFAGMNVDKIQKKAEQSILETTDAFINTLETRLDNGSELQSLLEDMLQDYEHDAQICQIAYLKDVIHSALISMVQNLADPAIKPLIAQLNTQIPKEMQEFLNIQEMFDKFIAVTIKALVDKLIGVTTPISETHIPAKDKEKKKLPTPPPNPQPALPSNERRNHEEAKKDEIEESNWKGPKEPQARKPNDPTANKSKELQPSSSPIVNQWKRQQEPEKRQREPEKRRKEPAKLPIELKKANLTPPYKEKTTHTSDDLEQYDWYFPSCDRKKAEFNLSKEDEDGSFLVRKKDLVDSPYALSVFYHREVLNVLIRRHDSGKLSLGCPKKDEATFSDVSELVTFHRNNPVELIRDGSVFGKVLLKADDSYYSDAFS